MRRVCFALALLLAGAALPALAEFADWSTTAPRPLHLPEIVADSAIVVGDLFVAIKEEVLVCDLDSPDLPIIGRCAIPGGHAYHARIIGGELYIACGSHGVVHVDITDPAAPAVTTFFDPDTIIVDIGELSANTVAVSRGGEIFVLGDLASGSPTILAEHDLFQIVPEVVTIGSVLVVPDGEGIVCVDLSIPESPVLSDPITCCTEYGYMGWESRLLLRGTTLYATTTCCYPPVLDEHMIQRIDLSDPMNPVLTICETMDSHAYAVGLTPNDIVTTHNGCLAVAHPDSFTTHSLLSIPVDSFSSWPVLIADNDRILLSNRDHGTVIFQESSLATITPLATRPSGYDPFDGGRFGYRLWTVSSDPYSGSLRRFEVFDQSDPFNLVQHYERTVGVADLSDYTESVVAANDLLVVTHSGYWHDYGGDGWWETKLAYLPSHFCRLNLISTQGGFSSVLIDNILWTRHGSYPDPYYLKSFDLPSQNTEPLYSTEISSISNLCNLAGFLAYFDSQGLTINDVSDSTNPVIVDTVELPEGLYPNSPFVLSDGLFVVSTSNGTGVLSGPVDGTPQIVWNTEIKLGGRASLNLLHVTYLATKADGPLVIFDLADPDQPIRLCEFDFEGISQAAWHGSTLYLAVSTAVYAYDMTVPASPTWIGQSWPSDLGTYALTTNGEYLFHNNLVLPLHSAGAVSVLNDPNAGDSNRQTPNAAVIESISPNPFNPRTTVTYRLDRTATVQVTVHDLTGRRLATLVDRSEPAGQHTLTWLGTDDVGRDLPSGVYFVRVLAEGQADTRKVALIR